MELPLYTTILFILCSLYVSILLFWKKSFNTKGIIFIGSWIIIQSILAYKGVFQDTESIPPKLMIMGIVPSIAVIIYIIIKQYNWIKKLSLEQLHWIHLVRLPVEFGLLWLFQDGLISKYQTFEGWNFDIIAGITAPIMIFIAIRFGIKRNLLIAWNIFGLLLLSNIVITSVLCFPFPLQQLSFDQPNIAMLYFPYNLLPSLIVPIVYFSHFASLKRLIRNEY